MGRYFIIILCSFMFTSCKQEIRAEAGAHARNDSVGSAKNTLKTFKMYELSEMAMLMERIYSENSQLKQKIARGDAIGHFPEYMLKIYEAEMTDASDNDAFFKDHALKFIKAQQLIYEEPTAAKQHFNDMVTACITCHEGKCGGPVQRIKKLYIK